MLTDEQIRNILGMHGALPLKDGATDSIIEGREAILIVAIRAILAAHSAGAQEPVAWMRSYRQFGDTQSAAPDPGYMVTSFHQNAEFAAKYPDENTPLYAHPQPITDAARDVAINELRNIVRAKRFDRKIFECDGEFADWAQNRARYALSEIERLDRATGE